MAPLGRTPTPLSPRAEHTRARKRWHLLLPSLALCLLLAFLAYYLGSLPDPASLDKRQPLPATRILDRNGLLLYEIADPARGNYQPIPLDQIPLVCRQAIIATEDSRFYQHPGVDLIAILRAAWADWRSGAAIQGGSTLTQQLARTLLLDDSERYERSLRRKLREATLAWQIERRFSKDDILALYLNNIYFGHYATGLQAASQSYFGRPAAALDLAQCALLAGLPQSPAAYNPIEHLDAAKTRQQQVLDLMIAAGYLTDDDARRAAAEPLAFAATPFPIAAPHFVFYVQGQIEVALGRQRLAQVGLHVTTTLDLPLNQAAETSIRRRLDELNRPAPDLPLQRRAENAALVALDPATGALRAFVGSPDYFDTHISGALNSALALRQPGSALKPLTYAVAMDPGLGAAAGRPPYTPATVLADVPGSFLTRQGDYYHPLNYDLTFHGPVPLRYALANSYNIPAVRTLETIGIPAFLEQARRHGITTFGPAEKYGLALTLGGGEVTLLELTTAYAPFARAGRPTQPIAIARIEDDAGQLLFDAGLDGPIYNPAGWDLPIVTDHPPILDPRTAFLITDILSDNDARARSFGFSSPLHLDRPAAAKTGTTTDWRDNWTVGYTPDLLAGVWVGNADNTPMYGASGIDGAAPIWRDFMTIAHKTVPIHTFPRPSGLLDLDICVPSGLLPSPDCPQIARETFIAGSQPTHPDDQYQRLAIDLRTGQPATLDTPASALGQRLAWAAPPLLRDWAQQQGLLLTPSTPSTSSGQALHPPPLRQAQGRPSTLQLLSPEPNAAYLSDPRLPADAQKLQLAISYLGDAPLTAVTYLLDGAPIAEATAWPWTAWWPLTPGAHTIQALAHTQSPHPLASPPTTFTVQ